MKKKENSHTAEQSAGSRSLKIQSKIRFNRWGTTIAPEIKLSGSWLEELGFEGGKRVVITTSKGLLMIRLEEE
jgi:cell division inhibitor SulA